MFLSNNMTRAWAEIDLSAIRQNFNAVKSFADSKGTKVAAVVKANAYGHGAAAVAKRLEAEGLKTAVVRTSLPSPHFRKPQSLPMRE